MASSVTESPDGEEWTSKRKSILLQTLDSFEINTTTKPYNMELNLEYDSGGTYCKNLFLKDRIGHFYYILLPLAKTVDMKKLKEFVKSKGNMRFASKTDVKEMLNCDPGAINPLGVMFNKSAKIRMIFDESLNTCSHVYVHPFIPNEATAISFIDLIKFVENFDHSIEVYDL